MTDGDVAMIFAYGGLAQGVSFLIGGLILIPVLGPRLTLLFGCMMYALAPVLTYACMVTNAGLESLYITYGLLSGFSINIINLGKYLLILNFKCKKNILLH